jgi:glycosyltransferase involved in cell wall biosynthesis
MRIAVVDESRGISGAADYARELARALAARHEIVPESAAPDVIVYGYAPYAAGVWLGWLRAARTVRRLRRRGRLVVVFHEVFERPDERLRMRVFARLQAWTTRTLVRSAVAVVLADEARATRLRTVVPRAQDLRIVPVGPNIPVQAAGARSTAETVLVFGLLHPDRDVETVVDAVEFLRARRPAIRLRIVGDLSADPARAAALQARAHDGVSIDGVLAADEIAAAFAAARVFVSTYVSAVSLGSGTVAAALAYGLPVVVFEEATLHEALVPVENVL